MSPHLSKWQKPPIDIALGKNDVHVWRLDLGALQEHLGIGNGETIKASTAFAAGFARSANICGALSGAAMAVGIAYGSDKMVYIFKDDIESHRYVDAMQRVVKICKKFEEYYGTTKC